MNSQPLKTQVSSLALPFALLSLFLTATSALAIIVAALSTELKISREALEKNGKKSELARNLRYGKSLVRTSTTLSHLASFLLGTEIEKVDSFTANSLYHMAFYDAPYEQAAIAKTAAQLSALGLLSKGQGVAALTLSTLKEFERFTSVHEEIIREESNTSFRTKIEEDITQRYQLIAKDFSELLSLPIDEKAQNSSTLHFYESGVFQGLPPLKGIPDQVEDLNSLRTILADAGGAVKVDGVDIASAFASRLEVLRADCINLRQDQQQLRTEEESRLVRIKSLEKELDSSRAHSKGNIREIFISVLGHNPFDTPRLHKLLLKINPLQHIDFTDNI